MSQFINFKNRPPHIFYSETFYFFTSRTVDKIKFFDTDYKKIILLKIINEILNKFAINCHAWVILDNHYHLIVLLRNAEILPSFFRYIHGKSTIFLNKLENKSSRKIWWNYWDHCIRDEEDFWKHFNYIHHNPVKHGYAFNQSEVKNYKFCSYRQWVKMKGDEFIDDCFRYFPIGDFTVED